MTTILSTVDCQEAYNKVEDAWLIGKDFKEEDGFDMNTIEWSEFAWNEMKQNFMDYLQTEIERYEKRYKTNVERIALVGHVGRWNGSFVGGRMLSCDENPLECMGNVDNIDVSVDEDGSLFISGHHHDGSHAMQIYFLSENKLNKLDREWDAGWFDFDANHFEQVYNDFKPLKLTKSGRAFYNPIIH
ncbi:hypothetical protein SIM22_05770 [Bacillus cereus group sp. BfR-BA-01363]|uniref:hypothetical protein n=1 Tax=Bacillus cereus group sp. BfR-BA-01363 TaxID=3094882 RepID=UPI0029C2383F|nr:hypothetical protein [Bacillus cereus group sp. BfR-BA-01363]MDX5853611.1 hypothetical protein [Bacillus cereus group sp. BfR-BA-01363]